MPKLPKGMFRKKGRPGWYMRLFRSGSERWVSLGADYAKACDTRGETFVAKKFFYVCMGLLALMAAAGVGFNAATAQVGGPTYFAGVGGASAEVLGRNVLFVSTGFPTPTAFPDPVPGSSDIASVLVYNAGYGVPATTVVLTNGDTYHWSGAQPRWDLVGSFGGTPVQTSATTWGQVKARYR